jgi:DNA adenine methylase
MLEDLHSRLSGVVIECLPYRRFIDRYDRPGTLFYVDPPYWGGENDYGKGMFERTDYELLAEGLAKLKGTFILSINDVPEIREIFSGFSLDEVTTNYSVSNRTGQNGPARELIITP